MAVEAPGQASRTRVPSSRECSRVGIDHSREVIPAKSRRDAVCGDPSGKQAGRQCPRSEICRQVGSSDQSGDELRPVVGVSKKKASTGCATTPWPLAVPRELAEAD